MPDRTEEARETIRGVWAGIEQVKADQVQLDEEIAERQRQRAAQDWASAGGETASRDNPNDYLEEPSEHEREAVEDAEEEAARRWAESEDE